MTLITRENSLQRAYLFQHFSWFGSLWFLRIYTQWPETYERLLTWRYIFHSWGRPVCLTLRWLW